MSKFREWYSEQPDAVKGAVVGAILGSFLVAGAMLLIFVLEHSVS